MTIPPTDSLPQLYRVRLQLLTYLWNEGFEKAEQPWLQLYTDNGEWARGLPKRFSIPEPNGLEQELKVKVKKLAAGKVPPDQDELDGKDWDLEGEDDGPSSRFVAFTLGLSARELDGIVRQRLAQWNGV